jgi:hypothetical protein
MKRVIGLALAFAFTLSTAPAIAEDAFHAFSTMPAAARASLAPLDDNQLAAIEGENIVEPIHLLLAITPENAATLISQIFSSIQNQLNIESTPTDPRNVKEVIQLNIGPTPNAQSNVVAVTQR